MRTTGAIKGTYQQREGMLYTQVYTDPTEAGLLLTAAIVESYLSTLETRGYTEGTIKRYRNSLAHLLEDLPEDKRLKRGTLAWWREYLQKKGYAARTINHFISAANSLLEFLDLREFQLGAQLQPKEEFQPELTRAEYLCLLQTAKTLNRERVYLLVKLFATTGLPLQELPKVNVEAVEAGRVAVASGNVRQIVQIPECLRQELLAYAKRSGRGTGPIFLTREGTPMCRTNVTTGIRQLCAAARVPEEKGNPRCLKRLYHTTRTAVEANISLLVEQAMDRQLENEQLTVGWEENS